MIRIEALKAGYNGRAVVGPIDLSAPAGRLIVLLGPNGSGKSTLLKTMAGIIKPMSGGVWIGDRRLGDMPLKTRARQLVYLSQTREAMADMKVKDILEIGRAPYRGPLGRISAAGYEAIDEAVRRADISAFLSRAFGELSGGEQSRVLLARMLVTDANVLLADEPIAALDPYFQISALDILKAEAARGKTVIAALHDLSLAGQYAEEVWLMNEGKIESHGPAKSVLTAKNIKKVFTIQMDKGGYRVFGALQ